MRARPLVFCLLVPSFFHTCPPVAAETVSAEQYRRHLNDQAAALDKDRDRALSSSLKSLAAPKTVTRPDGAVQTSGIDEWQRRAGAGGRGGHDAREALVGRQKAFEEWDPADGRYYVPADAEHVMDQLVGTGQIRVTPTWWEQLKASVIKAWKKSAGAFFRKLANLLNGLFSRMPAATAPAKMPDTTLLVRTLFVAAVLALLYVLWILLSKLIGNHARSRGQRDTPFLSGEDEELLQLPLGELQARARQFAEVGDYRQALRHLYLALLVRLEELGVWHYDTRRTNWEHIARLRRENARQQLIEPLSDVTRRFDRVRYGNAGCDKADWLNFEQDVEAIEQRLAGQAA